MRTGSMTPPVRNAAARFPGAHRGRVLLALARAGFVVLSVVALAACVASVPTALARFGTLFTTPLASNCPDGQASDSAAQTLQSLGISLHAYAVYTVTLMLLAAAIYVGVAALVFWRRSNDWMGLLTATFLLTFGTGTNGIILTLALQQSAWAPLLNGIVALGNISIGIFFFTFPTGRFVPRWTVWAMVAWMAQVPGIFTPVLQLPQAVSGLLFVAVVLIMVVAVLYRYQRVSNAVERQQTKWVVFGGVITAATEIGLGFALDWADIAVNTPRSIYDVFANTAYILVPLAIPLSVGIAILRYRLWDIDVIINKALVYGSLTALLAGVYFPLVIGTQTIAQAVTGRANLPAVVIVASTLLIVVLFNPLRHRIQVAIDRRFYRTKYDAQKTLATFGATLRTETDLSSLSNHLVAVVDETMQPTHVSLWLRPMPRETMQ